jgi:hypothetical protein
MQTVTRDCQMFYWKQTPQKHFYPTYFNQATWRYTQNVRTDRRQKKSLNTTEKEICLSYYAFTSYWSCSSYRHVPMTTVHLEPSLCVSLHSFRKHSIGLKSKSNYQTLQDIINVAWYMSQICIWDAYNQIQSFPLWKTFIEQKNCLTYLPCG